MSTPNDPKKPQGTPPGNKPPVPPAAGKPVVPAPGAGQGAKPQPAPGQPPKPPVPAPGAKPPTPAGVKPPAPPAGGAKPLVPGEKPATSKLVSNGSVPLKPAAAKPAPGQLAAPPAKVPAKPAAPAAPGAKPAGKPAVSARAHKPAPVKASTSSRSTGRRLGQVFVDLGYLDEDQLWATLEEAKNTGVLLGQAALTRGLITEIQLQQALADQFGLKLLPPEELKPAAEALSLVPETMASVYKVLPLTFKENVLTVVLGDPSNLPALDDLRNFLGVKEVVAALANPSAIAEVLTKCYLGKEESIMDIIAALQDGEEGPRRSESSIDLESLMEIQDAAPVRKLLNMVMLLAIKDRASDIHFEPFEDEYKMRYRCDGVLYEMVPPPRHLAMAISTRIKVMANLDIAERRLPQDGRIELNVGGNSVDMRVSILPTMFGESCVKPGHIPHYSLGLRLGLTR